MKSILAILTLLLISHIDLFSQGNSFWEGFTPHERDSIYKLVYSDEYIQMAGRVVNGSEDPEDIKIVAGIEEYLVENWDYVFNIGSRNTRPDFIALLVKSIREGWLTFDNRVPYRVVWEWSYDNLKVDTLSVINDDILTLLDYYDGKIGSEDDYNVDYRHLLDIIVDDPKDNGIDTYRKYYTLRIDTLYSETVVYYSLSNEPIEDIFSDSRKMEQFGHAMGYINYDGRPILVSGSGADQFFKRDSTIVMSPTYRTRVERNNSRFRYRAYLIGETKGFFLYQDGEFRLCRTSFVPFWQDREFYLDDVRQRIEGSFGSFLPYRVAAPLLSPDVLECYRTREPLQ